MDDQKHFSLKGDCLAGELTENEQIEELLAHARKELRMAIKWEAPSVFKQAAESVERAHLLNDLCTAFYAALGRLNHEANEQFDTFSAANGESTGESHTYLDFLKRALVPELKTTEEIPLAE